MWYHRGSARRTNAGRVVLVCNTAEMDAHGASFLVHIRWEWEHVRTSTFFLLQHHPIGGDQTTPSSADNATATAWSSTPRPGGPYQYPTGGPGTTPASQSTSTRARVVVSIRRRPESHHRAPAAAAAPRRPPQRTTPADSNSTEPVTSARP